MVTQINIKDYADCTCYDKSWTASTGIDKVACYTWWGQKRWRCHIGGQVVGRSQDVRGLGLGISLSSRLKDRQLSHYMMI